MSGSEPNGVLQELDTEIHRDGTLVLFTYSVPHLDPLGLESHLQRAVLTPLDRELRSNPDVTGIVLKGRFPLWFFAAGQLAIYRFLRTAYEKVRCWQGVFDPKLSGAVVVHSEGSFALGDVIPLDPGKKTASSRLREPSLRYELRERDTRLKECVIRFVSPGRDLLAPSVLRQAVGEVGDATELKEADVVLLDGPYPAWLATGIVLAIYKADRNKAILMRALQAGGDVVVESGTPPTYARGLLLPLRQPQTDRPPLVVGIIGDPNSGKSVLSLKLYHVLRGPDGLPCYRLDCDAYAPTAEWTLHGVGPDERRKWKLGKGHWTPEDERNLSLTVERVRKTPIELLLLDLPGGDFSQTPPQRIPPGRADLFRQVDQFILIAKNESAKTGWVEALRQLGKHQDITVIVHPDKGDVQETVTKELVAGREVPSMRIGQLDRDALDELTWGVEKLAALIRDEVNRRP